MNDALAVCKTAIEANDPSQASYFSLKIEPDFREAKKVLQDKPVRIQFSLISKKKMFFNQFSKRFNGRCDFFGQFCLNLACNTVFNSVTKLIQIKKRAIVV